MEGFVQGKSIEEWIRESPVIGRVMELKPVFWVNGNKDNYEHVLPTLPFTEEDMVEAEKRWIRFAPLIARIFPETKISGGIIESELREIPGMKAFLERRYKESIDGRLFLKCDSHLHVAGSIKARGGIYEVLMHAEKLALESGLITTNQDYSVMAEESFRKFFSSHSLAVGSTGNLGLSIGIMGCALGFKVTVHMSGDAKQWKKDLLRSKGVNVIEYAYDYSKAVAEGRRQSQRDPMSYFVDDEHSKDLFLGYSVAAYRLKKQLESLGVIVDHEHPLFVYLPCGVGGAPGGVCFGLKNVFKDNVHCFFVEPTHSPCMLLGLVTGEHEKVSVQDFGIDNKTDADGLAVGTPSGLVGRIADKIISGVYTVQDDELYRMLAALVDSEEIKIEPSAAASLTGPYMLYTSDSGKDYIGKENLESSLKNSTHIAWATGGLLVPPELMDSFYDKGKKLLKSV